VSPARRTRVLGKKCLSISVCVWSDLRYRYVLSNRFLFKLVEQPPADMAALLHAFPSTPPVVRRRSKELLDVIRDAVKRALSGSVEGQGTPLVAETSGTAVTPIESDGDDLPTQTPPASHSPSLWSRNKGLSAATTSSLFGASMLSSRPHLLYSATTSSLFGSVHPSGMPKVNSLSRFQDVVKKIHSTLVITPTVAVRASC
jgi:exosome complex exonuclease RRP6